MGDPSLLLHILLLPVLSNHRHVLYCFLAFQLFLLTEKWLFFVFVFGIFLVEIICRDSVTYFSFINITGTNAPEASAAFKPQTDECKVLINIRFYSNQARAKYSVSAKFILEMLYRSLP